MTGHKRRLLALLLGLSLLCGCAAVSITRSSETLLFYYCRADLQSGGQTGALAAQPSGLNPSAALEQTLARYLSDPQDETLLLPLPEGTNCTVEALQDGLLTLRLEGQELPAETVQDSLLAACLTLTMLQLDGVEQVSLLRVFGKTEQLDGPYTADSFLLADASAQNPEYAVSLYYPGRNGLLVERTQILNASDAAQLPLLALQALISGTPVNPERAVPAATQVLDFSITDATANVVLSDAFMACDTSDAAARGAVRSITATLCALDGIASVQLSVIGEAGLTYIDISQPISPQSDWYAPQ